MSILVEPMIKFHNIKPHDQAIANQLKQSSFLRKHLIEELSYQKNNAISTVCFAKPQVCPGSVSHIS